MIEVTFSFKENVLNHLTGSEAKSFLLGMAKENPVFLSEAADRVTVYGPWGSEVENRE